MSNDAGGWAEWLTSCAAPRMFPVGAGERGVLLSLQIPASSHLQYSPAPGLQTISVSLFADPLPATGKSRLGARCALLSVGFIIRHDQPEARHDAHQGGKAKPM